MIICQKFEEDIIHIMTNCTRQATGDVSDQGDVVLLPSVLFNPLAGPSKCFSKCLLRTSSMSGCRVALLTCSMSAVISVLTLVHCSNIWAVIQCHQCATLRQCVREVHVVQPAPRSGRSSRRYITHLHGATVLPCWGASDTGIRGRPYMGHCADNER